MALELLPKNILEYYEAYEWKHACAILKQDFPNEWNDIIEVLANFKLRKSWIINPGGRKSKISEYIDSFLYSKDWVEKEFITEVVVDENRMESPTHKIDCYKNKVA